MTSAEVPTVEVLAERLRGYQTGNDKDHGNLAAGTARLENDMTEMSKLLATTSVAVEKLSIWTEKQDAVTEALAKAQEKPWRKLDNILALMTLVSMIIGLGAVALRTPVKEDIQSVVEQGMTNYESRGSKKAP